MSASMVTLKVRIWLMGLTSVPWACGRARVETPPIEMAAGQTASTAGQSQLGDGGAGHAGAGGCECFGGGTRAPLECACSAGLCPSRDPDTKFERDHEYQYPLPYVVLFGTCASGHQVIQIYYALEAHERQVWDNHGRFVYSTSYPGVPPAVCDPVEPGLSGLSGIGDVDPSEDCQYCVVAHDFGDGGAAGAGGVSGVPDNNPYGPLAAHEACGSELYE